MKHHIRFVRTFALSGSLVACGGGSDQISRATPEPAAEVLQASRDAGATDAQGAGAVEAATDDSQTVADAAALVDAQKAPRTSGPLAPPELPAELRG